MANVQLLAGSTGVIQIDFKDGSGATITPPSQYSFSSNNAALVLGTPTALNKVPYTCSATPTANITVTATCTGINNGTALAPFDIITGTETGPVVPGLPSAGGFQATAS